MLEPRFRGVTDHDYMEYEQSKEYLRAMVAAQEEAVDRATEVAESSALDQSRFLAINLHDQTAAIDALGLKISDQTQQLIASQEALATRQLAAVAMVGGLVVVTSSKLADEIRASSQNVSHAIDRAGEKFAHGLQMVDRRLHSESKKIRLTIGAVGAGVVAAVEHGVHQLKKNEAAIREVAVSVESVREAIETLERVFDEHLETVEDLLDSMDRSLAAIRRDVHNPIQTRAYNHFRIARDAARRGHTKEALQSLEFAITGDRSSEGYPLEWRFHLLRGNILLGSHPTAKGARHLPKAETALVTAATHAATSRDADEEVLRSAWVDAAWAAYLQRQYGQAIRYAEQAQQIKPTALIDFAIAKMRVLRNELSEIWDPLARAVRRDPVITLQIASDPVFTDLGSRLTQFLEHERQRVLRRVEQAYLNTAPPSVLRTEDGQRVVDVLAKRGVAVARWWLGLNTEFRALPLLDLCDLERQFERQLPRLLEAIYGEFEAEERERQRQIEAERRRIAEQNARRQQEENARRMAEWAEAERKRREAEAAALARRRKIEARAFRIHSLRQQRLQAEARRAKLHREEELMRQAAESWRRRQQQQQAGQGASGVGKPSQQPRAVPAMSFSSRFNLSFCLWWAEWWEDFDDNRKDWIRIIALLLLIPVVIMLGAFLIGVLVGILDHFRDDTITENAPLMEEVSVPKLMVPSKTSDLMTADTPPAISYEDGRRLPVDEVHRGNH